MNVVSTVLFGESEKYVRFLPALLRAHHNLYRGWRLRVYHDADAIDLRALHRSGLIDAVLVERPTRKSEAFLWRLMLMWDEKVNRFVCRDIDAIPSEREFHAVQQWITSGLPFHAISDLAGHHDWPTLGGMIGMQASETFDLLDRPSTFDELIDRAQWPECAWQGKRKSRLTENDQLFLAEYVWPKVRIRACEHRLNGSRTFGAAKCFREMKVVNQVNFSPFIGSADVDIDAAVAWYKQHGDPEIEARIAEVGL